MRLGVETQRDAIPIASLWSHMNHEDDPDDDPDDQLYTTGTGYDDGVEGMPSPSEHRAPRTRDEVLEYLDRCERERLDGEAERDERRREGAPEPRAPRRGFSQY